MRPFVLIAVLAVVGFAADAWGVFAAPHRPSCPSAVALVMGAAQYDGDPSPAFERRLRGALDLYQTGCVERIVVSGGSRDGDRSSEGAAGRAWLIARGVPDGDVAAETRATDTIENVANSLPLLGDGAVVVVSDAMHLHRSLWVAHRAGLEASGHATPSARGRRWSFGLREVAILAFYRASGSGP